jgi:hypothetical protein
MVDSLYHVWTSVSVERDIIWGIIVHSIHKGEVCFCLACTFKKAIKNFGVKVDVQKDALRFT